MRASFGQQNAQEGGADSGAAIIDLEESNSQHRLVVDPALLLSMPSGSRTGVAASGRNPAARRGSRRQRRSWPQALARAS
jgi:hypothetical protein